MIVEVLVAGILGLLSTILDVLPEAEDLGLPDLSGAAVGYAFLNTYLPMGEGVAVGVLIMSVWTVTYMFKLVDFIYKRFPFKAT